MPTRPTRVTLAALSIASVASIMPTRPLVSTRPRASPLKLLLLDPARVPVRCWRVATGSGSVTLGVSGLGRGCRRLGEGQNSGKLLVRPGDHLDAHDLADPAGRRGPRVDGRLHGRNVAGHEGRDQAAADLVPADQLDVG